MLTGWVITHTTGTIHCIYLYRWITGYMKNCLNGSDQTGGGLWWIICSHCEKGSACQPSLPHISISLHTSWNTLVLSSVLLVIGRSPKIAHRIFRSQSWMESKDLKICLVFHWPWKITLPLEENKAATYSPEGLDFVLPPRLSLIIFLFRSHPRSVCFSHSYLHAIQNGSMENSLSSWPLCCRIRLQCSRSCSADAKGKEWGDVIGVLA